MELIGGLIPAIIYLKYGLTNHLILYSVITMGLYLLSLEDVNSKTVFTSDFLILLSVVIIVANVLGLPIHWLSGFFLFVTLKLIHFLFPSGMGDGDGQVGFLVGIICPSIWSAYLVFTLSFVIGAIYGIVRLLNGGERKDKIPYIPFLSMSFYIFILIQWR